MGPLVRVLDDRISLKAEQVVLDNLAIKVALASTMFMLFLTSRTPSHYFTLPHFYWENSGQIQRNRVSRDFLSWQSWHGMAVMLIKTAALHGAGQFPGHVLKSEMFSVPIVGNDVHSAGFLLFLMTALPSFPYSLSPHPAQTRPAQNCTLGEELSLRNLKDSD